MRAGRRNTLEQIDLARYMVDAITSKMGADILLLDLSGVTLIADYFIIATADSQRQLSAISEEIVQQVKEGQQISPLSVEGTAASGWVLVDYGGVVVHLFTPKQREFYRLEDLWAEARTVVRIA